MDPMIARKTWRTAEPIHGMIYFAPQAHERYRALGLSRRMGYFASRGAALGPVPAEIIVATFFNFYPGLVRKSIPAAWSLASPDKILSTRLDAADAALRSAVEDTISRPELREAADLGRRAAEAASEHPEGRPLFAAHAALPWPTEAHLMLWHAQSLLREYRGDAHIAALLLEGLTAVDALVIHGATGDVPPALLQQSRAWPDDEWQTGVERMRSRGFLAPSSELTLTEKGKAHRQWVEDRTDANSVPAYEVLGEDGCARLRQLTRPLSKAVIDAGLLSADVSRIDDE
jgi:hypothetical protein